MMNKEANITASESDDYLYTEGWFQAKGLHNDEDGAALIIYLKTVPEGKLSLVWYRPNSGYKLTGIGNKEGE